MANYYLRFNAYIPCPKVLEENRMHRNEMKTTSFFYNLHFRKQNQTEFLLFENYALSSFML